MQEMRKHGGTTPSPTGGHRPGPNVCVCMGVTVCRCLAVQAPLLLRHLSVSRATDVAREYIQHAIVSRVTSVSRVAASVDKG